MEEAGFSDLGWFNLEGLPEPLFQPMKYALDSLRTGRRYYAGPEGNGICGEGVMGPGEA